MSPKNAIVAKYALLKQQIYLQDRTKFFNTADHPGNTPQASLKLIDKYISQVVEIHRVITIAVSH